MVPSVDVAAVCWLSVSPAGRLLKNAAYLELLELMDHFHLICAGALTDLVFILMDMNELLNLFS